MRNETRVVFGRFPVFRKLNTGYEWLAVYVVTAMTCDWTLFPEDLQDDQQLLAAVLEEHEGLYRDCFIDDPGVNHLLPVRVQAFRRVDSWRVFLLLTPWMLSRIFVPDSDPGIEIPGDWCAEARAGQPYRVIGPANSFELLTGRQKAHLNYSNRLGHYLLHPLILSMKDFQSPEEVFRVWNRIIETRNRNLQKLEQRSHRQEEITRREFFKGPG